MALPGSAMGRAPGPPDFCGLRHLDGGGDLRYRVERLRPTQRWLAAAPVAVVAFTPQFVFISGAINNDTAVAALSALVLWLVVVYGEKPRSTGG